MLRYPKIFFILNLVVRVIYSHPPDILNNPYILRMLLQKKIMVERNVLAWVLCRLFGIFLGFISISLLHFPQDYRFLLLNSCEKHFQPPPAKLASSLLSNQYACITMNYINIYAQLITKLLTCRNHFLLPGKVKWNPWYKAFSYMDSSCPDGFFLMVTCQWKQGLPCHRSSWESINVRVIN